MVATVGLFVLFCITLVDYYVTLLFLEIELLQPEDFCQTFYLCEQRVLASRSLAEDKCEIFHLAISEVIVKLKDPDTQLEIIELLLKACDAVENYAKKCKTLVFEYGPFISEEKWRFNF
ncbi:hypothetical protein LOK49_LG04G01146 [Camellia lanceoleosa]|uniref:Uncharacterized protein n=1 Tax=Camellia lanceoleosa TaxID=1840588 RepID=A0ACC0HY10_9ERIC|nr:hypothetical protein LOK49_LG04G01146 [Camellia lanceoleosa]